jgi:hypothetical protein
VGAQNLAELGLGYLETEGPKGDSQLVVAEELVAVEIE